MCGTAEAEFKEKHTQPKTPFRKEKKRLSQLNNLSFNLKKLAGEENKPKINRRKKNKIVAKIMF